MEFIRFFSYLFLQGNGFKFTDFCNIIKNECDSFLWFSFGDF